MRISYVRWYAPQEKMPEDNEIVIIKCNFLNEPTFGYYLKNSYPMSLKNFLWKYK